MKVMLVNGSPHKSGTTNRALDEIANTLEAEGIEVGRFWVGNQPLSGCLGCGYCGTHGGECVCHDVVNEFNALAASYDGYIFGTPVHYAAASGALTSFMDRSFYSVEASGQCGGGSAWRLRFHLRPDQQVLHHPADAHHLSHLLEHGLWGQRC